MTSGPKRRESRGTLALITPHCWSNEPDACCVLLEELQVYCCRCCVACVRARARGGAASNTGSSLMDARAQAPAQAPALQYPAVEDGPPMRGPAMTPDQQMKLKQALVAARDRQGAKPAGQGESTAPAKP
jgi:hypothetical protein